MKTRTVVAALSLTACVQVSDRQDSAHARIDTSSGLLAVATPTRIDSTPTGARTPPLIGADSTTAVRGTGSAAALDALRSDTAVALVAPDSASRSPAPPAATGSDLDGLGRTMQVPVAGITPAMLHDTYAEMRGGTRKHEALDIPAPRGTPVLAATNGRVLKLFNSKAGGLMVYTTDSTERFILMYGHLDAYQPGLADGQPLRRGQQLGIVGTTGNAPPTVPHLHFAIARSGNVKEWWKGTPVNPFPLLRNRE